MEIISYLKGKKAQKEVESLKQVIGQDQYKSGNKDIIDAWATAKERIDDLEKKNKDRELSDKLEGITQMVAMNLNKQALQMTAIVNAKKYNHTNMVIDTFTDLSGIDITQSIDYEHDTANGFIYKPVFKNIIPNMNGVFQKDGVTISASSTYHTSGHDLWRLFDRNINSVWGSKHPRDTEEWVQISFDKEVEIVAYSIKSRSDQWTYQTPARFNLLSSNDAGFKTNVKTLHSVNDKTWSGGQRKQFLVSPSALSKNFRIAIYEILDGSNHPVSMLEAELLTAPQEAIIVTNLESTNQIPSQLIISIDGNPDSIEVSRDNGVTWMPVIADKLMKLNSLPEGNELRFKFILKDEQIIRGVSYSWI